MAGAGAPGPACTPPCTTLPEPKSSTQIRMGVEQKLWSSGQCFWLQIQRSRVRSPALPDFLSSNGSGTGSTQPREPREVN